MKNHPLTAIFQRFAGAEVAVSETTRTRKVGGQDYEITDYKIQEGSPVMADLHKTAKDNNLRMRVWLPNTFGTMDHRLDRMNVDVKKGNDGKWRLDNFRIG